MFHVWLLCVKEFLWNKISTMTFLDPLNFTCMIRKYGHRIRLSTWCTLPVFLGVQHNDFAWSKQRRNDFWVYWPQYQEIHLNQQTISKILSISFQQPWSVNLQTGLQCSWYSDLLQAGNSRDQIIVKAIFSAPIQFSPGPHPASYTIGSGHCQG
jgi:hypothetical protein